MSYIFEGCELPDWCQLESTGKLDLETLVFEEEP
jgi:hypothetical protein